MKYPVHNDRLLPQSLEAERAVLGAMLLSPIHAGTTARNLLSGVEFSQSCNMVIFSAIGQLIDENKPVDEITLSNRLKSIGALEDIGGMAYLLQLRESTPTASNVEHYIQIVIDRHLRREAIGAAHQFTEDAFDAGKDFHESHNEICSKLLKLETTGSTTKFYTSAEATKEYVRRFEEAYASERTLRGLSTGFSHLDELTCGLQAGEHTYLGGISSTGKSALAGMIAMHVAGVEKTPVGIITLEQEKHQWPGRMIAARARVNVRYPKSLTPEERERFAQASTEVLKLPIYYDDRRGLRASQIKASARYLCAEYDCKLLILDHLLLTEPEGIKKQTPHEYLTETAKVIDVVTGELQVHFMVLTQIGNDVEKKQRQPNKGDLKECGNLIQTADNIWLVSPVLEGERKFLPKRLKELPKTELDILTRVNMGKQRDGDAGPGVNVYLPFEKHYTLFREICYPEASKQPDWRSGPSEP